MISVPKILSIGAATQDVFLKNSRVFKPVNFDATHELVEFELGSKIDVNRIAFSTGGGATNAATTFARQGLDSSFMGVVGRDLAGEKVIESLDREFIDTSRVEFSEKYNTDYSTIILTPDGERTILTYRGASSHIFADNFRLNHGEFDWIYVSNLAGRMDALSEIFHEARKKGVKIAWNPGKKELEKSEIVRALLEDVEILILNKDEAKILVEGENCEELVRHCLSLVKIAIITDGANGVWASDGKTLVRAGMYEDVRSLDRTGAGDAFGSGFLSQWSQGADLKQSLLFASANSTSVIQYIGAKEGILRKGAELHLMPMHEEGIRV